MVRHEAALQTTPYSREPPIILEKRYVDQAIFKNYCLSAWPSTAPSRDIGSTCRIASTLPWRCSDLLFAIGGRRHGFEFKFSDAPGTTRSMRIALRELSLERLWVVYPGDEEYALDTRITALPIRSVAHLRERLAETNGAMPAGRRRADL